MNELTSLVCESTLETLYTVAVAALFSALGGLTLGLLLVLSHAHGILAAKLRNRFLETITNTARSIPFIILLVAIVPITRFVVGTSIGTNAAIVALVVGAIPYVTRLIETALLEVDGGVIEAGSDVGRDTLADYLEGVSAGRSSGFDPRGHYHEPYADQLLRYDWCRGGLGDLAIRYGYQRFGPDVMISTVAMLIVIVQTFQFAGNRLARKFERR
jgi:D-methionine transport system permease protein